CSPPQIFFSKYYYLKRNLSCSQTWVLKVSIHCEGCKKKVKRILRSIPGVYDSEIDARQNKVTVKAIVDAETLIKKLSKSGKQAKLWPEKKPSNQDPNTGDNSSKKESKASSKPKEPSENPEKKPIPSETSAAVTAAAAAAPAKVSDANKTEAGAKPQTEPAKADSKPEESNTEEPQISDAKKADTATQQPEKPAATVDSTEKSSAVSEASSDNGGGKKKGNKSQKRSSEDVGTNSNRGSINPPPPPPPQHTYSHPTYPPPPAYVMSYNMAQPTVSQAYYASPMPPSSQGYVYMPYPPPPEFYYGSMEPSLPAPMQPPHDNVFSDENPNACNLM
ncbi:heavy metal-associated isoprenylated plant protein 35-like, partial [Musa acuminata AAA Group]|uniref:heavy metal-associated isoprenylated plant protein 35-like n=1 Tax=Musa acuminata AAA Group TaxID=214697 RepID=UPI0031DC88CF